ncbi:MAG: hypothetical protein HYX61_00530 [Gammaproteobacteria bacterium]|jgi:hypothetical protein|nr:hypothetical protein [Gammaproteobacteria bacterium]
MDVLVHTLDTLLDLEGQIIAFDNGCWAKFEAKRITKSDNRPHGVKYSLTFHNRNGDRIIGYDNAHKIPGKDDDSEFDHKHHIRHGKRIKEYTYVTAAKLVEDFFKDIDKFLEE